MDFFSSSNEKYLTKGAVVVEIVVGFVVVGSIVREDEEEEEVDVDGLGSVLVDFDEKLFFLPKFFTDFTIGAFL